ncbi:MAG: hypothetical protein RL230_980 [Pseudomonadota bacterium]
MPRQENVRFRSTINTAGSVHPWRKADHRTSFTIDVCGHKGWRVGLEAAVVIREHFLQLAVRFSVPADRRSGNNWPLFVANSAVFGGL